MMLERNHLSRIIRYSTQDAYWNRTSDNDSCKAASRIGRLRDPRRPKKLTKEQSQQVRREPRIVELYDVHDRLRVKIVSEYGVVKMAEGEQIHKDYLELGRILNSAIRAEERALLKRIQEEYDTTAPMIDIQRQLNGEDSSDDEDISEPETVPLKFVERCRIAEAALCDPSTFAAEKGFRRHVDFCKDLIALCKRRERRRPRTYRLRGERPVKTVEDPIISPKSEPEEKRNVPLKCTGFQCLFCLASSDLPLKDREYDYASKFSLQRHTDRCRLNKFKSDEKVPGADDLACGAVILEGKMHFKRHAADVHNFVL
jgi:hypothetical protein